MILLSHPTGNANVRQTAISLHESGLLSEFWTCLDWDPDGIMARLLPSRLQRQLRRRTFPPEVRPYIRTNPGLEMGRLFASSLGLQGLTKHESGYLSVDAIYRALDRRIAHRLSERKGLRGVYAYEDGASETFDKAHRLGIKRFYDLPAGYWRFVRTICEEEREREPEWASTLRGAVDSDEKTARKDEELQSCDLVLVASTFCKNTLKLAPAFHAEVVVIPYGAPSAAPEKEVGKASSGKLRVLFVGNLTQQKGIAYLFRAAEMLAGQIELTVIGRKPAHCSALETALLRHRWMESIPHQEVIEQMRRHDVLVLPSLSDGFGLVILEAMSQGLPIITTPHTGGPDVISEGEEGYIVPVRSPEIIADRLSLLLSRPEQLREMKFAAWKKAKSCSWQAYRTRQAEVLIKSLQVEHKS